MQLSVRVKQNAFGKINNFRIAVLIINTNILLSLQVDLTMYIYVFYPTFSLFASKLIA